MSQITIHKDQHVFLSTSFCYFAKQSRPMKTIKIDKQLSGTVGKLQLGVLSGEVQVGDSPEGLIALLNKEAEEIAAREEIEDIAKLPQVHATREAYKALGKKPARYRVSSEALHRRIVQGKGLYFINNIVDINNLVSIRSGCGICLYDVGKIKGDIAFRIAADGESYHGIGKYDLNLNKLPVFADEEGPFGSPTSDSERTKITENTQSILFVIVSFLKEDLSPWLDMAEELLAKFANAQNIEKVIV